jgi:polysaccharide biosynthesis/export protein
MHKQQIRVGKNMKKIACATGRGCIIAAVGIAMGACGTVMPGLAPGGGLNPVSLSGGQAAASDASLNTEFREITPQLVSAEQKARKSRDMQDLSGLVAPAEPYRIEKGDVLSIVVWDHPELNGGATSLPAMTPDTSSGAIPSNGFTVDRDGLIQFPYAGVLNIAGLTQDEARKLLSGKLARYINKPNVTLQVQSYRSKRIYIDGEVKQPGVHAVTDIPMTLVEAINRAGGMLPSADQSRITLARSGSNYEINMPQMVQRGLNPAAIMLRDGDVLRVRSREESKVFVSGEVVVPRALTMHNGRLSLNEALGESGGINPLSGDASQVYIVRRSSDTPVVYRLDAQAKGALTMAEGFELEPKDLVYVAATPLANWHRTISQIIPGALPSAVNAVHAPR